MGATGEDLQAKDLLLIPSREIGMAASLLMTIALVLIWIFFANAIARRLSQRWEAFGEIGAFLIFVAGMVGLLIMLS